MAQHFNDRAIARTVATLDVARRHQLRIARETMQMNCIGARVMGGPNHREAVKIIHELSGVFAGLAADCTCKGQA